jgi:hypothetical protein
VSDNKLGCINDDYFYVRNLVNDLDFLYDRRTGSLENVYKKSEDTGISLKKYGISMMITADYLIKNNKTR